MKRNYISISFMTEKVAGRGEDAPPLLLVNERCYTVGVFDGMGGSGATLCNSPFGEGHTKAYVASRLVKNAVEQYLKRLFFGMDIDTEELKNNIYENLQKQKDNYPDKTRTMLRSKILKDYPTTMAMINVTDMVKELKIDAFWAGDSRCYIWTSQGLYQISKDDLANNNDPMENLRNDAPMTNCISASNDFRINHKSLYITKEPIIFFCASDGCFAYYPTPMDFEFVLRNSLCMSQNKETWKEKLMKSIQEVTGDDTSLSLICMGFSSFDKVKNFGKGKVYGMSKLIGLRKYQVKLRKKMLRKENLLDKKMLIKNKSKLRILNHSIETYKKALLRKQRQAELKTGQLWDVYKKNHLKYLNED